MDWGNLGYFTLMAFVGLSTLTVCVGLTVRLFLAPVLRDVADRIGERSKVGDRGVLERRIESLDERLAAVESGLDRIEAAQEFDRRLGAAAPPRPESA